MGARSSASSTGSSARRRPCRRRSPAAARTRPRSRMPAPRAGRPRGPPRSPGRSPIRARGLRDQTRGAPVMPREPATTSSDARRPLVRIDARARERRRARRDGSVTKTSASHQVLRGSRCRRPARRPAHSAPGSSTAPILAAPNVTVRSRAHGVALDRAGGAVHAGGDVDRHDRGRRPAFSASIAAAQSPSGMPAEPRAEDRVDRYVGARELALQARRGRTVGRRVPPRRAARRCSAAGSRGSSGRLRPTGPPRAMPQRARWRAATRPSPPLFPLPHTTTARRP